MGLRKEMLIVRVTRSCLGAEPGGGLTTTRSSWARGLAVVGFFAGLTALLAYPLSLEPGSRALALGNDTRLFVWTLAWDVHALLHDPLGLFDANIFFPARNTLAYSENLFGNVLVAAPVLLASGNPVLAMNAVVLVSCALCGVGAFVLGRRLGIGTSGALASGIVFAFASPHFAHLGQVHLATVHWIPFCLAFLHAYAEQPRRGCLLIACGFFTLQSLSSGHAGLYLLLTIVALVIHLTILGRFPWRNALRDLVPAALVLAINLPFLLPYFAVRREVGLRRSLGAVDDWAPTLGAFLAAPTHAQGTLLSLFPALDKLAQSAPAYLFPGWLTLLFAAMALLPRRAGMPGAAEPGRPRAFYALLAVLSFWASLGPRFGLYTLLYRLVPGFDLVRVPSRLTILMLLGLSMLAGFGLERLLRALVEPRRRVAAAGGLALIVLELSAFPLEARPYSLEIPALDRFLANQPRPFAVMELPVRTDRDMTRLDSLYMIHSMAHWQPIVNGYSGTSPKDQRQLHALLASFPDDASLAALEQRGVDYVVLHRTLYKRRRWDETVKRLAGFEGRLRLVHETTEGRVYALSGSRELRKQRTAGGVPACRVRVEVVETGAAGASAETPPRRGPGAPTRCRAGPS